ncbi:hypothetical protein [Endozoicomonas numazuensis]|uniref:hypothetical protein n=1 Tax=Endozoicomonas numazuensis TaxID=1137799 RepID=UPI00068A8855|nr:hypothetical protein [Endozoicomonas numazuensis]
MIISKPEVTRSSGFTRYTARISYALGNDELEYSLPDEFSELVSDRADAALLALLIPAMDRGEPIKVEGVVSEHLYHHLSGSYQHVLKSIMPHLQLIDIFVDEIDKTSYESRGVATGFSGGIDSYCTLADYFYADVLPGFKVTHLIYNNVGSHGKKTNPEVLFNDRYEALKPIADKIGLPFIKVNSNLDHFYCDRLHFMQTHTARNTSVALLLQKGIGRYLYGSAYAYPEVFIGKTDSMAHSDLMALPMLSTESLSSLSVGSEYTRAEKTIRVAGVEDSYTSLDVCVGDEVAGNCSQCIKCLRTLLTLDIAGELDKYSQVFDLEVYRQHKDRYCSRILISRAPLEREIALLANKKSFRFPLSSHLGSLVRFCTSGSRYVFRHSISLAKKFFGRSVNAH